MGDNVVQQMENLNVKEQKKVSKFDFDNFLSQWARAN